MPRRAAHFTQADIARAIRAAKQEGAAVVEQRADCIRILLTADSAASEPAPAPAEDASNFHL